MKKTFSLQLSKFVFSIAVFVPLLFVDSPIHANVPQPPKSPAREVADRFVDSRFLFERRTTSSSVKIQRAVETEVVKNSDLSAVDFLEIEYISAWEYVNGSYSVYVYLSNYGPFFVNDVTLKFEYLNASGQVISSITRNIQAFVPNFIAPYEFSIAEDYGAKSPSGWTRTRVTLLSAKGNNSNQMYVYKQNNRYTVNADGYVTFVGTAKNYNTQTALSPSLYYFVLDKDGEMIFTSGPNKFANTISSFQTVDYSVVTPITSDDLDSFVGGLYTILYAQGGSCDLAYPSWCIAPAPPKLNCDDIIYTNFLVVGNDVHGFDPDKNGIGCEYHEVYLPITLNKAGASVVPPSTTSTPSPTKIIAPSPTAPPVSVRPPGAANCSEEPNASLAPNYPVRITGLDKLSLIETVQLTDVSNTVVNVTGWKICSIKANQLHAILNGSIDPGSKVTIDSQASGFIWNNDLRDDAALYDEQGRLVSYWNDL